MRIFKQTLRTMVISLAVTVILMAALFQASAYGARKIERHQIEIGTPISIERDTGSE